MVPDEAVEFCENVECEYCPIYVYELDGRSRVQKEHFHVPCCFNLIEHSDWHEGEMEYIEYKEWRK